MAFRTCTQWSSLDFEWRRQEFGHASGSARSQAFPPGARTISDLIGEAGPLPSSRLAFLDPLPVRAVEFGPKKEAPGPLPFSRFVILEPFSCVYRCVLIQKSGLKP